MHGGFAFLEVGTVRKKNQVNALVKIISDFAISTVAYFLIGYGVAYGINFLRVRQPFKAVKVVALTVKAFRWLNFSSVNICRSHSGNYFWRHCRAR